MFGNITCSLIAVLILKMHGAEVFGNGTQSEGKVLILNVVYTQEVRVAFHLNYCLSMFPKTTTVIIMGYAKYL